MIKDPIDGLELALRAVDELEREHRPALLDIGSITLDLEPAPGAPRQEGRELPSTPVTVPTAHTASGLKSAVLGMGLAAALAVAGFAFWPKGTHAQQPPPAAGLNPLVRKGLPDPLLTPGDFQAGPVSIADAKPIPLDAQAEVLRAYGVSAGDRQYVVLRLIPTTLGGTDAPKNLFVTTPWFAGLKARLDQRLTELVAARQISADHARGELTRNWVQAVHGYYVRNYGQEDIEAARRKEDELRW